MTYTNCRLSLRQKAVVLALSAAAAAVAAVLFYESPLVMVLTPVFFYFLQKWVRAWLLTRKRRAFLAEFTDAMQIVRNSLLCGRSVENAFFECRGQMEELYGEEADMCRELSLIEQSLRLNVPIEQLIEDLARRTDMEDIRDFSEVFSYAKRSGADLAEIIERTLAHIREKADVQNEIEASLSGRRLEQIVMDLVPIGILLYLKLTSGDYLAPLYHTPFGVVFMSACLAAYAASVWIGERIIRIRI